jgi:glutamate 5-kinase
MRPDARSPVASQAYDADEARRIAGRKSTEIEAILGYAGRAAMIHRDDMVIG